MMNIIQIPTTNFFPNRYGSIPKWIIVHGTAGGTSAQDIAVYYQSTQGTQNPVSSHYVIDQQGTIVQCVSEHDGAWGNGLLNTGHDAFWPTTVNPNNLTISIEHCKASNDNSNALTEPQKQASFWLIDQICTRWNIPRHTADASGGITGHYSLDPINRSRCPGPYPFDELWTALKGSSVSTTPPQGWPLGWHDDGKTLTAPNGHKVIGGFRQYIYSNFWDNDDYPLGEETNMGHLELGNPSLGGGIQQIFRKSMLEISANKPGIILRAWTGQEVAACRSIITQLNNTISDLTKQIAQLKSQQAPGSVSSAAITDAITQMQHIVEAGDELSKVGANIKNAAQTILNDLHGLGGK